MEWTVKAPGSCGELVQGAFGGVPFLITCPVDIYTTAYTNHRTHQSNGLGVKAQAAVAKTLAYLQKKQLPLGLCLSSSLPRGKGMASSSADIAAVCQLTALAHGRTLSADEISAIAASIEPTDGIFYDGIVMINHISGVCLRHLGEPPPLAIAIFDTGGEIDTVRFNCRRDIAGHNRAKAAQIEEACELAAAGIAAKDGALVGRACTLSAFTNQALLHKKALPKLYDVAQKSGAFGVNTAHSGTVVGLFFEKGDAERLQYAVKLAAKLCSGVKFFGAANLIAGGLTVKENEP